MQMHVRVVVIAVVATLLLATLLLCTTTAEGWTTRRRRGACAIYNTLGQATLFQNFDPYVDYSNATFTTVLRAFQREAIISNLAHPLLPPRSVVDVSAAQQRQVWQRVTEVVLRALNAFIQRGTREGTLPAHRHVAEEVPPPFRRTAFCPVQFTVSRLEWLEVLHRPHKTYGFQVEWVLTRRRAAGQGAAAWRVQRVRIRGNVPQEQLELATGGAPQGARHADLQHAHAHTVMRPPTRVRQLLQERHDREYADVLQSQHYCVDQPQYTRRLTCIADKDEFGRPKPRGTWDRPCRTNDECPFYEANQNYPNQRGGCRNGRCEMPINVRRIGFRQYDRRDAYQPFCHNCKNAGFSCCASQAARKDPVYSQLVSPDYVFSGDQLARSRHADMLRERGMVVHPKIVAIVPTDVFQDYTAFLGKRDPRLVTDFYGTRRDVAELILLQRALYLGGSTTDISIQEGELTYLAIKETLTASDTIHMSGTTVWQVDFVDDAQDVRLSDPLVRVGEFEAGIYMLPERAKRVQTPADVRNLEFVSSKQWTVDWRTLRDLKPRAVFDVPQWHTMTQMVTSGRVDALLAPFQSTPQMELVLQEDGKKGGKGDSTAPRKRTVLHPVRGIKMGLSGSRHFAIANNPGSKKVLFQLNAGLQRMRKDEEIVNAYRESGFFHSRVRRWKKLPA